MANITLEYSSENALTLTLASLANGAYRESTEVDNDASASVRWEDALVGGKIRTGTSPTNNRTIQIFAYGTIRGFTTNARTAGVTGADAAYTPVGNNALLLKPLETIVVTATSNQDYFWGPISMASRFGGILPVRWGIVVFNDSAVALNATGSEHYAYWFGVRRDVATS